jgi:hypothetical protein
MGDNGRAFLRHAVATVAYRAGKVLRDVPAGFEDFRAGSTSRTAGQVLAHLGDLFDWAATLARGAPEWTPREPVDWNADVDRFFAAVARFDEVIASDAPLRASPEAIFQGPVADALTHVGQLALLRRLAGSPVRGENYFRADIVTGRVGRIQTAPRREFE